MHHLNPTPQLYTYVRKVKRTNESWSNVCKKAPIKGTTIPRLELMVVLIGVRCLEFVTKQIKLPVKKPVKNTWNYSLENDTLLKNQNWKARTPWMWLVKLLYSIERNIKELYFPFEIDIETYSSITELFRVTALESRFVHNLRKQSSEDDHITAIELKAAEEMWLQYIPYIYFQKCMKEFQGINQQIFRSSWGCFWMILVF